MSWFNNLLEEKDSNSNSNSTKSLQDKDLALDLLTDSKNDIAMLSKAVSEAANPQLRHILANQLNVCINDHFQLTDMTIQKGWYNAFASPGQQIRQDLQDAQNIINNQDKTKGNSNGEA